MFVVATAKYARLSSVGAASLGVQPAQISGAVRANSNTCRSYGAWRTAARVAIDMALLTELLGLPLLPIRGARHKLELLQDGRARFSVWLRPRALAG